MVPALNRGTEMRKGITPLGACRPGAAQNVMAKTGRSCTVCQHRERAGIDLAIARGVSMNALAKRYGLGADSLGRHSRRHMPPQLRAALIAGPALDIDLDRLRETESQSLLVHLVSLRHRLFATLDLMEENGDAHGLATLSSQLHRNLEITGRLLGDLMVGNNSVTNILISPAYVELRHALVGALAGFPEARIAVAAVLHRLEGKAADAIRADTRELAGAAPRKGREPLTIEHEAAVPPAPPAARPLPPPPAAT